MAGAGQSISEWPIAVWVVLVCVVWFLGRYAVLYRRWRGSRGEALVVERRLAEAASRLRSYATGNAQRLPDRLEEAGPGSGEGIVYRPVPSLTFDERLILLHDARPVRTLLQFPHLRKGRGVILSNGRVLELTEEAFEKLLDADDRLRQSLGLQELGQATLQTPASDRDADPE